MIRTVYFNGHVMTLSKHTLHAALSVQFSQKPCKCLYSLGILLSLTSFLLDALVPLLLKCLPDDGERQTLETIGDDTSA